MRSFITQSERTLLVTSISLATAGPSLISAHASPSGNAIPALGPPLLENEHQWSEDACLRWDRLNSERRDELLSHPGLPLVLGPLLEKSETQEKLSPSLLLHVAKSAQWSSWIVPVLLTRDGTNSTLRRTLLRYARRLPAQEQQSLSALLGLHRIFETNEWDSGSMARTTVIQQNAVVLRQNLRAPHERKRGEHAVSDALRRLCVRGMMRNGPDTTPSLTTQVLRQVLLQPSGPEIFRAEMMHLWEYLAASHWMEAYAALVNLREEAKTHPVLGQWLSVHEAQMRKVFLTHPSREARLIGIRHFVAAGTRRERQVPTGRTPR